MFWNLLPKLDPTATWTRAKVCDVGMSLLLRRDPGVELVGCCLSVDVVAVDDDDTKDGKCRGEFSVGSLSESFLLLGKGL
jgi:hypothetical protein